MTGMGWELCNKKPDNRVSYRCFHQKQYFCVNFTQKIWKFQKKLIPLRKNYIRNEKREENRGHGREFQPSDIRPLQVDAAGRQRT